MIQDLVIYTSQKNWLAKLAKAYKDKQPFLLVNDTQLDINPEVESLLDMGKKAELSKADWVAVGLATGLSVAGIYMVVLGVYDPEPTSKLALLIGGGLTLTAVGGFTAIRVLTGFKPPKITVKIDKDGNTTFEGEFS